MFISLSLVLIYMSHPSFFQSPQVVQISLMWSWVNVQHWKTSSNLIHSRTSNFHRKKKSCFLAEVLVVSIYLLHFSISFLIKGLWTVVEVVFWIERYFINRTWSGIKNRAPAFSFSPYEQDIVEKLLALVKHCVAVKELEHSEHCSIHDEMFSLP